jgi:putative FmdB family regulatory protein
MPLYQYECGSCKEEFDKFISIANREVPTTEPCPKCQAMDVRKSITKQGLTLWETNLRPDDTFTDILKQVQKKNKGSTMDEKFYK